MPDHRSTPGLTRRGALQRIGSAGVGLSGLGFLGGTVLGEDEAFPATSCMLTAEQEEGPYYLDLLKIRRDVTEGKAGLYFDLRIKVIDASSCEALSNVAVDIWHAAPNGRYSGFSAEGTSGQTYLRGVQLTDSGGVAQFRTLYPGWYAGRATHVHVMAHVGGRTSGSKYAGGSVAHTGQVFFSDATTDKVAKLSPYSSRTITRQRNATDRIYARQGGSGSTVKLARRSSSSIRKGFVGRITLAIDT